MRSSTASFIERITRDLPHLLEEQGADRVRLEVVAALVPVCVEQSKQDPNVIATLASLKDETSYKRGEMLMKTGWATMPGSADPDKNVAKACMDKLAEQF